MSVKQMALVWEHEFPHNKQSVMLALTDHANDLGEKMFPSVARLAWKTGYSSKQVSRIIKFLIDDKVLVKVRLHSRYRPNEYKVDWSRAVKKEDFISDKDREDKMSTLSDPRVDISNPRVDTTESTEPSLEPSFNNNDIGFSKVIKAYQSLSGLPISEFIYAELGALYDEISHSINDAPLAHPNKGIGSEEFLVRAIQRMGRNIEKPNINYLDKIVQSWLQDGVGAPPPGKRKRTAKKKQPNQLSEAMTTEELEEAMRSE